MTVTIVASAAQPESSLVVVQQAPRLVSAVPMLALLASLSAVPCRLERRLETAALLQLLTVWRAACCLLASLRRQWLVALATASEVERVGWTYRLAASCCRHCLLGWEG